MLRLCSALDLHHPWQPSQASFSRFTPIPGLRHFPHPRQSLDGALQEDGRTTDYAISAQRHTHFHRQSRRISQSPCYGSSTTTSAGLCFHVVPDSWSFHEKLSRHSMSPTNPLTVASSQRLPSDPRSRFISPAKRKLDQIIEPVTPKASSHEDTNLTSPSCKRVTI